MDKRDYYDVLGVSKNATEQEINSAIKKIKKKNHETNKENNRIIFI